MRSVAAGPVEDGRGHEVHGGRTDEAGDEEVRAARVELLGRPDLLQHAELHDGDAVAHRHRLDLIVRDVDRRRPECLLQLQDLGAGLHAELRVEVRQRLVHQKGCRLAHDRSSERDTLALATGQLLRLALDQRVEVEDLGCSPDALSISFFGTFWLRRPNARLSYTVMCG